MKMKPLNCVLTCLILAGISGSRGHIRTLEDNNAVNGQDKNAENTATAVLTTTPTATTTTGDL